MAWVDEPYPQAEPMVQVREQRNPPQPASLSEAFAPADARRLRAWLARHDTPTHGCWLHVAETDLSVLAFRRGTQEVDVTALIDHEEVLDRVARLLAAVGVLLVFGIGGAMDRSLEAIMPTRGG